MAANLQRTVERRLAILLLDGSALIQRWTVRLLARHLISPIRADALLRGSRWMQRLSWKLIRHFIAPTLSDRT